VLRTEEPKVAVQDRERAERAVDDRPRRPAPARPDRSREEPEVGRAEPAPAAEPPAPEPAAAAPVPAPVAPPMPAAVVAEDKPAPAITRPPAPPPIPAPPAPPATEIARAPSGQRAATMPVPREPPAVRPTGPVKPAIVPPMAVTQVSGRVPKVKSRQMQKGSQATLSAKLCIDAGGRVTSVTMLKSVADVEAEVKSALRSWRYKPYVQNGTPTPACFGVTFALKAE
jgi:hypothetical protein